MKILCTADLHIGRRPSRLPGRIDAGACSCARAWSALVDTAIRERVDLLVIAGDLVDQANRFYEAAGPVEAGVRALAGQGIRTLAVAGNHDHDILPWIADRFDPETFTLLGQGGRWERTTIEIAGRGALHVDGWSFPSGTHRGDPLEGYPRSASDGIPVLGLLHADLDQPGSRHAPVATAALRALPVGFWLLGHVHRPARHAQPGAATVLYPGSPQAMDPGEPGVHGPWMLEIDPGGRFQARCLPLSQVRYETLTVEVDGAREEGEVGRRVVDAVSAALRGIEEPGPLRFLSLRVRLTGRTALHRALLERGGEVAADLELTHGAVTAVVERVEVATRPQLNLEELARGNDAPGLLARLLHALDHDELDAGQQRLVQAASARAAEVRSARPYLPLQDAGGSLPPPALSSILLEQALLLLDELLAGREGEG